jgi:hypothetical protein
VSSGTPQRDIESGREKMSVTRDGVPKLYVRHSTRLGMDVAPESFPSADDETPTM